MSLIVRFLCITAMLFLVGCNHSGATNPTEDTTTGGTGSGGVTPNGGLVTFNIGNYETEIKFFGPRVHTIVGEVYRILEMLHSGIDENTDVAIPSETVVLKMIDASAAPADPFVSNSCENTAGILTEYRDLDTNGTLTAGDEILRNYDNFTCEFDIVDGVTPRNQPKSLTGSILFQFLAASDASSGIYVGTATYTNYSQVDGLLKVTDTSESEVFNGTVAFNINVTTGNATFSNINVTIDGGSSNLTAPIDISIGQIIREINNSSGNDSVQIIDGLMTSQISGAQAEFETHSYNEVPAIPDGPAPIVGPTGLGPTSGSLLIQGANSAARVVTRPNGGGTPAQLDEDGDGLFNEGVTVEPTSWAWFIGGFLMPSA